MLSTSTDPVTGLRSLLELLRDLRGSDTLAHETAKQRTDDLIREYGLPFVLDVVRFMIRHHWDTFDCDVMPYFDLPNDHEMWLILLSDIEQDGFRHGQQHIANAFQQLTNVHNVAVLQDGEPKPAHAFRGEAGPEIRFCADPVPQCSGIATGACLGHPVSQ